MSCGSAIHGAFQVIQKPGAKRGQGFAGRRDPIGIEMHVVQKGFKLCQVTQDTQRVVQNILVVRRGVGFGAGGGPTRGENGRGGPVGRPGEAPEDPISR